MKIVTFAGRLLLAIAALPLAASAQTAAQDANTIKIGKETKKTVAVVKELQNGDVACMMVLQDEKGKEFFEPADFEICFQKPSLIGKRVSLKYKMANVMAESCQGDPDCKTSDRVALVVEAKILGVKVEPPAPASGAVKPAK